jgi:hypothetical protein
MALRLGWAFQMTVVVRIVRAPRWAGPRGQLGGVVAVAAVPAAARALKRLASGSGTVPSRDQRLRRGTVSSAARSPAGSAFSGRTTPDTRPPDRNDADHEPFPAAAAATCPRRRNAHLPGTIRQPLQITTVRGHGPCRAHRLRRADLVGLRTRNNRPQHAHADEWIPHPSQLGRNARSVLH